MQTKNRQTRQHPHGHLVLFRHIFCKVFKVIPYQTRSTQAKLTKYEKIFKCRRLSHEPDYIQTGLDIFSNYLENDQTQFTRVRQETDKKIFLSPLFRRKTDLFQTHFRHPDNFHVNFRPNSDETFL